MLNIHYTQSGEAISDYQCEEYILKYYNNINERYYKDSISIYTSTELVIHTVRALIKEGKIDNEKVEFYFNGELVGKADKDGRLNNWPDGFCDCYDNILDRLLDI